MTQVSPEGPGYAEAVLGWTQHLRGGGTTPWADWVAEPDGSTPVPGSRTLPTSPQLALLGRLVAQAGGPVPGLDDRVLATSPPGRGPVDVPLPWPPGRPRTPSFGTPPLDPADLPVEELLRHAVGLLAHLLPGVPLPAPEATPPPRWPLPGRPRFRVHGPAGAAAAVRADLLAAGWVESDWRPRHVVVGLPVDQLLAQHWDAATRSGSGLRWTTLWRRRRTLGGLPAPVDLLALAGRLRGEGQDRVAVVLGRDLADLRARTASALGLPAPADAGRTVGVDGRTGDLRRRINPLLTLAADGTTPAHLRTTLALVLDPLAHPPVPPSVPDSGRAWAHAEAEALAAGLRSADYPVHGDPGLVGELAPRTDVRGTRVDEIDPDSTLELALAACLRAWRLQEGRD